MTCSHMNISFTKNQVFCLDCGQPLEMVAVRRGEERYPRPKDALRPGWHERVDLPPTDRPYWAAFEILTGGPRDGQWVVMRVDRGNPMPHPATHWHEDHMGLPLA